MASSKHISFTNRNYLRDFYVLNAYSLFQPNTRGLSQSIFLLCLEAAEMISLLLSDSYLNLDAQGQVLSIVSLHRVWQTPMNLFVICILILNLTILATLFILFIQFCLCSFEGRVIPQLSSILSSYNQVVLLPSIIISVKCAAMRTSSSSQSSYYSLYVINIVTTFVITFIQSLNGMKCKSYMNEDSLSKREGVWDYFKAGILAAAICVIEITQLDRLYRKLFILYCLMDFWDMLFNSNSYYNQQTQRVCYSLNLWVLLFSIVSEIQMVLKANTFTGLLPLLCLLVVAFKVGKVIVDCHQAHIQETIDLQLSGSTNDSAITSPKLRKHRQFLIDFFIRMLLEKSQLYTKKQRVHSSLSELITIFPSVFRNKNYNNNKSSSNNNNLNHLGSLIEEEQQLALDSLKEQVELLQNQFYDNNNNLVHTTSRPTLQSLFFLLEITQNYPKLAIKLHEFIQSKSHKITLKDQVIIHHLERQIIKREEVKRYCSTSSSTNKDGVKLDLNLIFCIQDELNTLADTLVNALKTKIQLINEMSRDLIDLQSMQKIGGDLLLLINQVAIGILQLRPRCLNSSQLSTIKKTFLESLWFDVKDVDLKLFSHSSASTDYLRNDNDLKMNNCYSNKRIDFKWINSHECTVMTSLSSQRFGRIIKASNNCEVITGFTVNELLDKNVSLLLPNSIAINHNSMIRRGVESGLVRYQYTNRDAPIVLKTIHGFGVRASLNFQIHMLLGGGGNKQHSAEVGLIAQIQIQQCDLEQFFIADINSIHPYMEIASQRLFQQLFSVYFKSPFDLYGLNISNIIPAMTYLKKHVESARINKLKLQSLAFFWSTTTGSAAAQYRSYNQAPLNILELTRQSSFCLRDYDVYLVDLRVTHYHRDGDYNLLLVKVKEHRLIASEVDQISLIKSLLMPQLVNLKAISSSESTEITDYLAQSVSLANNQNSWMSERLIPTKKSAFATPTLNPQAQPNKIQQQQQQQLYSRNYSQNYQSLLYLDFTIPTDKNKDCDDINQMLSSLTPNQRDSILLDNQQQMVTSNCTSIINKLNTAAAATSIKQLNKHDNLSAAVAHQYKKNPYLPTNKQELYTRNESFTPASLTSSPILHSELSNSMQQRSPYTQTIQLGEQQILFSERESEIEMKPLQLSNRLSDECFQLQYKPNSAEQANHNSNSSIEETYHKINDNASQQQDALNSMNGNVYHRSIIRPKQYTNLDTQLIYMYGCFAMILLIVFLTYFSVRHKIATQQLSFAFSWWQNKMVSYLLSIVRFSKAHILLVLQGNSITPQQKEFRDSISDRVMLSLHEYLEQFIALGKYSFSDLYLVELLHTIKSDFVQYIDTLRFKKMKISLYSLYMVSCIVDIQRAQRTNPDIMLEEQALVHNMQFFNYGAQVIQQKMLASQEELTESINGSILRSLIMILCISNMIVLLFLPFFYRYQGKKEFVLKLFASIDPVNLSQMYDTVQIGLNRMSNFTPAKKGKALKQQQSSRQVNPQQILLLVKKTKKNVPTKHMPKITTKLIFQITVLILMVNVQPFVSVSLISSQISESKIDKDIVKGLYGVQDSIMACQYFMYSYTTAIVDAQLFWIQPYYLLYAYTDQLNELNNKLDELQSTYSVISMNSRYSDTKMGRFLSEIFTGNLCEAINNASPSYFHGIGGKETFNVTRCTATYGGTLLQGYFTGVRIFASKLSYFLESVHDPSITPPQIFKQVMYNVMKMEDLFTMVKTATDTVLNCINEEKQLYYGTIDLTQILLFLFETTFLILLIPLVVVPFFKSNRNQMIEAINMLSLLQIQEVLDNSQIFNFVKLLMRG